MNIVGIGCDIVEVDRAGKLSNEKYLNKFLTQKEIDNINFKSKIKSEHIAGRFAAKEAIVKSLGTGFRSISPTDIEITNDELGKPIAKILKDDDNFKDLKFELSISHIKKVAMAYVICYKD